jgi:hypothetical protein
MGSGLFPYFGFAVNGVARLITVFFATWEVSSMGRVLKRLLIEALILAVPFVWRWVRERRQRKK